MKDEEREEPKEIGMVRPSQEAGIACAEEEIAWKQGSITPA